MRVNVLKPSGFFGPFLAHFRWISLQILLLFFKWYFREGGEYCQLQAVLSTVAVGQESN